jgi:hypothetical protein
MSLAILVAAAALTTLDQAVLARYGGFVGQVEVCREMGYAVASPDGWVDDVLRDTGAGREGRKVMSRAMSERRSQQDAMLRALAQRVDTPSGPSDLRATADQLAGDCEAIRGDEVGARLVISTAPADASLVWADKILEGAGRASWQTPAMAAAYNAMITVGLCKVTGPADQVELTRRAALATVTGDPRSKAYVEGGLVMADILSNRSKPDRSLCARLMIEDRARIGNAR